MVCLDAAIDQVLPHGQELKERKAAPKLPHWNVIESRLARVACGRQRETRADSIRYHSSRRTNLPLFSLAK